MNENQILWRRTDHLIRYDRQKQRVWVVHQRVHHGAVGVIAIGLGCLLALHDWNDRTIWFVRGVGELS